MSSPEKPKKKSGLGRRVQALSRGDLEDLCLRMDSEQMVLKNSITEQKVENKKLTTQLKRLQTNVTKAAGKDPVLLLHELEESHAKARKLELSNDGLKRKLQLERVKGGAGVGGSAKPKRGVAHNVRSRVTTTRGPSAHDLGKEIKEKQAAIEQVEEELEAARAVSEEMGSQVRVLQDELQAVQSSAQASSTALQQVAEKLRRRLAQQEEKGRRVENQLRAAQVTAKRTALTANTATIGIQRDAKDKGEKLAILQTKMDMTTITIEKLETQLKSTMSQLREKETSLTEERSRIASLTVEMKTNAIAARASDNHSEHIKDLEAEVKGLRDANEKIAAAALSGDREREHQSRINDYKDKVRQITSEARFAQQEKAELQRKLADERELRETIRRDTRKLQMEKLSGEAELQTLKDRMKFFTSQSTVDIDEMEQALRLVKEKKEKGGLDFLLPTEEKENADIRKQLKAVNSQHADTILELEKVRKLLRIQDDISKEYRAQTEEAETRSDELDRKYAGKVTKFESMLKDRNLKIHELSRRLRDIGYGTNQYPVKAVPVHGIGDPTAGLSSAQIQPGENLLEICISRAELSSELMADFDGMTPCTFVTFDFYEFETEHTAIRYGQFPRFDSVSQFIVEANDAFEAYLRKGKMTLELHKTVDVNYETLAACQISYTGLIDESRYAARKKIEGKARLYSLADPTIVFAEIDFWMRVQLPLDQALRLYHEREKARAYTDANELAETAANANAGKDGPAAEPGLTTLRVEVIGCAGIQSRLPNAQPSAYVAYCFHELKDQTTQTIVASNNPEFGDVRELHVQCTTDVHDYILESAMELYVIDDADPDEQSYLGSAQVPLRALAENERISGFYDLFGPDGSSNGQIRVELSWTSPYTPPAALPEELPAAAASNPAAAAETGGSDDAAGSDNYPAHDGGGMHQEEAPSQDATGADGLGVTKQAPDSRSATAALKTVKISQLSETMEAASDIEEEHVGASSNATNTNTHANTQPTVPHSAIGNATYETVLPPAPNQAPDQSSGAMPTLTVEDADASPAVDGPTAAVAVVAAKVPKAAKKKKVYPPALLGVDRVQFDEGAKVLTDPNVERLYVQLNGQGIQCKTIFGVELGSPRLETPVSLPKPTSAGEVMEYNHHVNFIFDSSPDEPDETPARIAGPQTRAALRELAGIILRGQDAILSFDVISEPLPEDTEGVCVTIGTAIVDLSEVCGYGVDLMSHEVVLYDHDDFWTHQKETKIGKIHVSISVNGSVQACKKSKSK